MGQVFFGMYSILQGEIDLTVMENEELVKQVKSTCWDSIHLALMSLECELKYENIQLFVVEWKFIKKTDVYNPGTENCRLCSEEKLHTFFFFFSI